MRYYGLYRSDLHTSRCLMLYGGTHDKQMERLRKLYEQRKAFMM